MASLSFGDIITKLRFLFMVVLILFGIMHVGAFLGVLVDVSTKRETMKRLCSPLSGFEETEDGVWTWRVQHSAMEKLVEAPRGSAVELASVFCFPFARLRVALPSELVDGAVQHCVGLRSGLSASGLDVASNDISSIMAKVSQGFRSIWGGARERIPEIQLDDAGQSPKVSPEAKKLVPPRIHSSVMIPRFADVTSGCVEPTPDRMVGTALILAHIANQRAISVVELGERNAQAAKFFRGVKLPGIDHDFDALLAAFMLMLGDDVGALIARKSWLLTARLWRFIFLQRADGSWDLTDSLAFAIGAHDGPMPPASTSLAARLKSKLGRLDSFMEDEENEEELGGEVSRDGGAGSLQDCPLTFHCGAMLKRIPPELAAMPDGETAWATLLAMTHLQRQPFCWLVSDPEEEDEPEVTIVDSARMYLISRCQASRKMRRLFRTGVPQEAAHKALKRWDAARDYAVSRARNADTVGKHRTLHIVQRSVSRVIKVRCPAPASDLRAISNSARFPCIRRSKRTTARCRSSWTPTASSRGGSAS